MEIVDSNGDSYGNSLCYMTIIDNEYPALIIDSFECKPPLCFSKEVPKTLKKLGEQMLKNMNCSPKGKVLFGVNFCNLDFPSTNEIQPNKGLTLIDSLANKTDYRDALGGYFETEYIQEINPITKNKLLELTQET